MSRTASLERLTASDMFLLLREDCGWSSDIGGLAILDGTNLLDRDGRVQIEKVHQQLEPRLHQMVFRPAMPGYGFAYNHPSRPESGRPECRRVGGQLGEWF